MKPGKEKKKTGMARKISDNHASTIINHNNNTCFLAQYSFISPKVLKKTATFFSITSSKTKYRCQNKIGQQPMDVWCAVMSTLFILPRILSVWPSFVANLTFEKVGHRRILAQISPEMINFRVRYWKNYRSDWQAHKTNLNCIISIFSNQSPDQDIDQGVIVPGDV